jgi:hypothetical protein
MTSFDPSAWHDFFVGSMGASAALTGLLFVAISINLEQILKFPNLPGRAAGGGWFVRRDGKGGRQVGRSCPVRECKGEAGCVGERITRAGARAWRTAHNVGWVPRHKSGRMRGDAQPGARQLRGVQPGYRLQGDGGPPTDQGNPGVVDGDGRKD